MTTKVWDTLNNTPAGDARSAVFIVDDDDSMRNALHKLLGSVGFNVLSFESTAAFRSYERRSIPSCLILDVRLKGESGLNFQDWALQNEMKIPIVFMTGFGDVEMSVRAMKGGAVNFLAKPFREQDMIDAVTEALDLDAERLKGEALSIALHEKYALLTPREQDVARLAAAGHLSKTIAEKVGLSEMTTKIYRARAMKKLAARTTADLVRIVRALRLHEDEF